MYLCTSENPNPWSFLETGYPGFCILAYENPNITQLCCKSISLGSQANVIQMVGLRG